MLPLLISGLPLQFFCLKGHPQWDEGMDVELHEGWRGGMRGQSTSGAGEHPPKAFMGPFLIVRISV